MSLSLAGSFRNINNEFHFKCLRELGSGAREPGNLIAIGVVSINAINRTYLP